MTTPAPGGTNPIANRSTHAKQSAPLVVRQRSSFNENSGELVNALSSSGMVV
jgi:hypothetical protein